VQSQNNFGVNTNLNISNIVNNNKSIDSNLLNKNAKSSIKPTKKNSENFNENIDSNTNNTFCNIKPQIKGFDKIDSENSDSNKESIHQSIPNKSLNNINIFNFKNEEDEEQINAKIMLKSKLIF
jgi:hypothetical protein